MMKYKIDFCIKYQTHYDVWLVDMVALLGNYTIVDYFLIQFFFLDYNNYTIDDKIFEYL